MRIEFLRPDQAGTRSGSLRHAVVALAASLAITACGDTTSDEGGSSEGESRPESIVSMSPTATEMLWAIGAEDQVVAVDEQSDYPEDVPTTSLSAYNPNVEAILEYEPDLVVLSHDMGDVVAGLDVADVPTLLLPVPEDFDEIYSQIERAGEATGQVSEATELVNSMRNDIDDVLAEVPDREQPLTYYHELDPSYYSVTDDTFIGQAYAMVGMESIAEGDGSGDSPQLSPEYIVTSDPDLIMLADTECCDVTPQSVAQRPGWDTLSAVQNDQIHVLDEAVSSRWGPRIVDHVETLGAVAAEATPATSKVR